MERKEYLQIAEEQYLRNPKLKKMSFEECANSITASIFYDPIDGCWNKQALLVSKDYFDMLIAQLFAAHVREVQSVKNSRFWDGVDGLHGKDS